MQSTRLVHGGVNSLRFGHSEYISKYATVRVVYTTLDSKYFRFETVQISAEIKTYIASNNLG